MKYDLPNKKWSYIPNVFDYLAGLDKDLLHYREHGLLHPADIYMTVFDEVTLSAERLINALNEMASSPSKRHDEHFNSLIVGFLFSISNYIDGCQSIVKTFCAKESNLPGKVNRDFKSQCKSYIDYVNSKINYIKHRHRKVATYLSEWDNEFILAYYITGLIDDDILGPDPDLHSDPNCAISLNWDIPFHITNVYYLGAVLESLLKNSFSLKSETNNEKTKHGQERYKKLLGMISKLKRNLLPDEIYKKQATVKELKNDCFELSYPSKIKANNNRPHIVNSSMTTDIGISAKGFVVPYRINKDYRFLLKNS